LSGCNDSKKMSNTMTKRYSPLVVLAFVLLSAGALRAASSMTSLQIASQAPDPIARGGTATYSVTITRTNTGAIGIFLSIPDLPPGAVAAFSANPVEFSSGSSTATATLTITTADTIAPGPHSFSLVAQEGSSHNSLTNSATLDVALGAPGLIRLSDGSWCFAFATGHGKDYDIQASTNFPAPVWTSLCTTNSGTNNLMVFVDHDTKQCPCRFYRTVPK
jgi:hypothetical protein